MKYPVCSIGDIHGCIEELKELVDRLKSQGVQSFVYTGDLVDRGPKPEEVVSFVRRTATACVIGNHDERALRYFKHEENRKATGKANPMQVRPERLEEWKRLTDVDIAWLGSLPYVYRLGDWGAVVHGGLRPRIPVDKQPEKEIIRLRYVDKDKGTYATNPRKPLEQPGNSVPWYTVWDQDLWVVCGHNVTSDMEPLVYSCPGGALALNIDTGCVYGGKLTAVVFEPIEGQKYPSYRFESVKARKQYCVLGKTTD